MKIRYFTLLWISICLGACSEKERTELQLSATDIQLDACGSQQTISILTNTTMWQISGCSEWLSAKRDSCFLIIEADCNPTRKKREGRIFVVAEGNYTRIRVWQEKSIRAVGDPYPDSLQPEGIIYKVMDGGLHGMVVSLDEISGKWGKEETVPECYSENDGKENTRKAIEQLKERNNFETDYPLFAWIDEKNKKKREDEWYIPAFHELNELYHIITGNKYKALNYIPTNLNSVLCISHNIMIRDRFDSWLEEYGGIPFKFGEEGWYWSSSVQRQETANACLFRDKDTYLPQAKKTEEKYARAILKF